MISAAFRSALQSAMLVHLLLALVVSPLPITLGHQHGCDDASRLADHIQQCHAGDADAWNMGWHWHLLGADATSPVGSDDSSSPLLKFAPGGLCSNPSTSTGDDSPQTVTALDLPYLAGTVLRAARLARCRYSRVDGDHLPRRTAQVLYCRLCC